MANLITPSFFNLDINIPNTGSSSIQSRVNAAIEKYERQCLLILLGQSLYSSYSSDSSTPRMLELKNGGDYLINGVAKRWEGLVYNENQSLIAYYIYYYYEKMSISQTTGVSTSTSDTPEGQSISPIDKMVAAWNNFSKESNNLILFLWNKKDDNGAKVYPEFDFCTLRSAIALSRTINRHNI